MSAFWVLASLLILVGLGTMGLLVLTNDSPPDKAPDSRPLSDVEDPSILVERAEHHENRRDWDRAADVWSRFIQVEPDRHEAYFRRALNAYREQRYKRALEDFETVLDEVEEQPPAGLHLYLARSARELDQPARALSAYDSYLDRKPDQHDKTREAVDYALETNQIERARPWLNRLRDSGEPGRRIPANLDLVEIALNEGDPDRAEGYLDDLESDPDFPETGTTEETRYLYLRGRWREIRGETEASNELYRRVYRRNSSFRNIQDLVNQQLRTLDESQLADRILSMDPEEFRGFGRRIVQSLGYEVTDVENATPEEVDLEARQQSLSLRSERVLFTLKNWQDPVAEIPIKEFEYKMVEGRYEKGYFATPGGFKTTAQHYAQGNQKLKLLGPSDLLDQLRAWYRSD